MKKLLLFLFIALSAVGWCQTNSQVSTLSVRSQVKLDSAAVIDGLAGTLTAPLAGRVRCGFDASARFSCSSATGQAPSPMLPFSGAITGSKCVKTAADGKTVYEYGTDCYTLPAQPGDIGVTYNGSPTASTVLVRHPLPLAITIPQNCTNSRVVVEIAPTSSYAFALLKNGVQFGTATISAAQTTASFVCASATSFVAGDILKVVTPASPDATLADIGIAIYITR